MKKIISMLLVVVIILPSFNMIGVFANTPITVELDNNLIKFDVQPVEINGRVLVPVRAIFEALGATVDWNGDKNEVISTKEGITIKLYKDNNTMYKNGKAITLDVPAKDINDRILVPVRAISEAFGCKVDWDNDKAQVLIKSKEYFFVQLKNYIKEKGKYEKQQYSINYYSDQGMTMNIVYDLKNDNLQILLENRQIVDSSQNLSTNNTLKLTLDEKNHEYDIYSCIDLMTNGQIDFSIVAESKIDAQSVSESYKIPYGTFITYDSERNITNNFNNSKETIYDSASEAVWVALKAFDKFLEDSNLNIFAENFGFKNLYSNEKLNESSANNSDSSKDIMLSKNQASANINTVIKNINEIIKHLDYITEDPRGSFVQSTVLKIVSNAKIIKQELEELKNNPYIIDNGFVKNVEIALFEINEIVDWEDDLKNRFSSMRIEGVIYYIIGKSENVLKNLEPCVINGNL